MEMTTSSIMLMLGLAYFFAHALNFIFIRYKVPDVLIFMSIGILLGPMTHFVDQATFGRMGETLSTLALVLILYSGGVTLDLRALGSVWARLLGITLSTAIATGAVFYLVGLAFGLSDGAALILGAVLSGTSSVVVTPMAQTLKMGEQAATLVNIESALTDVLCIVLASSFIQAQLHGGIGLGAISSGIGISLAGALIAGLFFGFIWNLTSRVFENVPNTHFATLAFGLLVYGAAELAGVSGGVTVLVFGFTLANAPWLFKRESGIRPTESKFYGEMIFILKTFFFVYMGISLVFERASILLLALLGILLCFVFRLGITRLFLSNSLPLRDRSYITLLIPKGLAAAVLAGIPLQYGIEGGETIRLLAYSGVFMSVFLCALAIPLAERPKVSAVFAKLLGADRRLETHGDGG